jgi:hypothetical protein
MEFITSVSGRSALDHFEFTDVRFGMRVPDTATVFYFIEQWNLLPAAAVQCPTLDSFKEQIPLSVLQQHI